MARAKLGDHVGALADYDLAIGLGPTEPTQHYNRGNALRRLERPFEAIGAYDLALARGLDRREVFHNRALALHSLGRFEQAVADCDQALRRDPGDADIHCSRGMSLLRLERMEAALEAFDTAVSLRPDSVAALTDRGLALAELGRLDEAIADFDQAIALDPRPPVPYRNKGIALALRGDLEAAYDVGRDWLEVEARAFPAETKLTPEILESASRPLNILLRGGGGLGDAIQFCRYAPLLAERGHRVLLAPQRPLAALLRTLPTRAAGAIDVLDRALGSTLPPFDFHCSFLGLPVVFRTTLGAVPNNTPYLAAEPGRIARWSEALGPGGFKIGVCWQGSLNTVDIGRSFSVTQFTALSQIPGVRLISLQKGEGRSQLDTVADGLRVEDLGPEFDVGPQAFLDTAAVMTLCDLVITSDTSVAHLAGALAVPTWLMLKQVPEWRWMLDRPDSPWYPTMKLFRQTVRGDWRGPFAQAEQELKVLLSSR